MKQSVMFVLFLMLFTSFASQSAQAGDDEWTTRSLTGFGIIDVAAEPTNPNVLYAATNKGLLLSWDSGHTWRALPIGATSVQAVLIHPEEATLLYAAFGGKLMKSLDGGQTWLSLGEGVVNNPYWIGLQPMQPDVIYVMTNQGLFRSRDAGSTWSNAGIPVTGRIQALAFHPNDPNVIFVVTDNGRTLFHTKDSGQSWTQVTNQLNSVSAISVTSGGKLFLQDRRGIQRSDDNGQSWLQVSPDTVRYFVEGTLVWDGNNPQTIYFAADNGVFRSDDEGISWIPFVDRLPGYPQKIIGDLTTAGRLFIVVDNQLFVTVDSGATWRGSIITTRYTAIQAHPTQSGVLFAYWPTGYRGNLWRSQDGGQTWQISNQGIEDIPINTLAFDPADANIIYAGADVGLYRSQDSGNTWSITGLPNNVNVLSVAVNPQNSAILFAGGGYDLLRSINNGESWTAVSLGRSVSSLAIDPKNPQTMYAIADGLPHRSTDGGVTWMSLNYPGRNALSLAIKPDDATVLFVSGYEGLFISRDGGSSLTPLATQLLDRRVGRTSLLMKTDPNRPNALYLAAGPNVYISPDLGQNWYPLPKGAPALSIISLSVDAGDPLNLYALYEDGSGDVWQYRLSQLPESPTPTPTATPFNTPTPFPTVTPGAQFTVTPVSGSGRLAITAAALAASQVETDATAIAVLGLSETESTSANESMPNTPEATAPVNGGASWLLIVGGLLSLAITAYGGIYLWRQSQKVTTVVAPTSYVVCGNCGAQMPSQAKFCIKCGQRL